MQSFASNHVSLVTGASTGIGAATAVALARHGSSVAVHYHRSQKAAEAVVERITQAGGSAFCLKANLRDASTAQPLVEAALTQYGHIDVLVNNAGSMIGRRTLLEITDEFWQEVMDTNVASVMRISRAVAPGMIERRSGTIINVSSIAARNGGSVGVMPYAAAKAAVLCMTKGLAKELIAHGIRVNGVNPGVIATPFHERFSTPDQMKALVNAIPQRRAGTAEEIASVICFLAGEGASHVVGETIEINGGMWMD